MVVSLFLEIPSDVFTDHIFLCLSTTDRYALLTTFPELAARVKWDRMYEKKKEPRFDPGLVEIYERHFELNNGRKDRLKAMQRYYDHTNIDIDLDECTVEEEDADCDLQQVPIISETHYKVEDYVCYITDYIYTEMRELKLKRRMK